MCFFRMKTRMDISARCCGRLWGIMRRTQVRTKACAGPNATIFANGRRDFSGGPNSDSRKIKLNSLRKSVQQSPMNQPAGASNENRRALWRQAGTQSARPLIGPSDSLPIRRPLLKKIEKKAAWASPYFARRLIIPASFDLFAVRTVAGTKKTGQGPSLTGV